jgi:hypothetical protein
MELELVRVLLVEDNAGDIYLSGKRSRRRD